MRILSISGQNIASLAAPFHIDLDAEPLRSAGLFAITGETGAGKSSILDAMCLALYGDAPRLSSGSAQDEVPDVGGDPIKARDPRAMLRRGAAQGWAAVTFLANDGQVYNAHWSARRARDRAEGRLQGVARQIARVSDGQVLASQLSAVSDQVQALTGLSYDEFRRTVLLAQGDFDAFLRAETNDRAALLEKVTGTGLYRAISSRVFDRSSAAQTALTDLIHQRDAHHLLSDDQITALTEDRLTLLAAIDTARAERLTLEADLARHQRHTQATARLAEAAQRLTEAQTARHAAQGDRARLATIDRAEPLRLPYDTARQAEAAQARAATTLAQAEADLTEAASRTRLRRATAEEATQTHDAKEAEFKTFGPIWSAATRLDSQILGAGAEAHSATEAAQAATEAAMTAAAQSQTLQLQAEATRSALTQASTTLTDLAATAPLVEGWDQIARDLADHEAASQTHLHASAEATKLDTAAATAADQIAGLERADAADRSARQRLNDRAGELATRIAALDASDPQALLTGLTDLGATLTGLDRARLDHAAALQAQATATAAQAAAQDDQRAAEAAMAQAQAALSRSEAAALALTAPAEQADLAASDAARALRLRLHPGEPCPVCGASDHALPADHALTALAARLRLDLAAAHAGATAARTALTGASGRSAGALARAQQADQTRAAEARKADAALSLWTSGVQAARATPAGPPLPDQPAEAPLTAARNATEVARQTALAQLSDLASLRSDKDAADTARHALTISLDTRAAQRQDLTQRQAEQAQAAALARQTALDAAQRRATLAARLAPPLAAAHEPLTALADPAALRQRLTAKARVYQSALTAHTALQQSLADLRPAAATAAAQAEDSTRRAAEARRAADTRAQTLTGLRDQRARLLNGEPTEAHRTRHNQQRLAAQTAKDAAALALSAAEAAQGLTQGTRDSATRQADQTLSAVEEAHDRLLSALAASDIPPEALAPLFALPRTAVETLRQGLRALEDAVTAALAAHAARQHDLTEATAAGLPDTPPEALTQTLATLDAAQAGRQEQIGALNTRLETDRQTRASLTGLETLIAAAKATADVWQAVNDAIGSRNGDAFARIAQSITLDLLVDHANHHLADLKPRYRLRRAAGLAGQSLALQVEDLDMGAEARATRSLSGGERFLVSLALALALSRMGDKGGLAATLFIDEGFGSLDAESLDLAIDALDTLQAQGRMIGVISHVEAMKDRIPVQVRVRRLGGGKSTVSIETPGLTAGQP